MPYLETISELVEDIADMCGIYNSDDIQLKYIDGISEQHSENCKCRICFVIDLKSRIKQAIKNEEILREKPLKEEDD